MKTHHHSAFCTQYSAFAAFAVALVTANAFGGTVMLSTADATAAATTSFNAAGGWSDGNAPSAGNDYVVALGDSAGLFFPTAAATFAGDSLAIGDGAEAYAAAGFLSSGSTLYTWTVANLILNKGKWVFPTISSTQTSAGFTKITVNSGDDAPFEIELSGRGGWNGTREVRFTSGNQNVFYGDANAVLRFKSADAVNGSMLGVPHGNANNNIFRNYKGQIILDGVLLSSASTVAIQGIGATDDAFRADRVVLKNGGGFGQYGYNQSSWSNAKLGVTVDATGGRLYNPTHSSIKLMFPFTGAGPLFIGGSATGTGWIFGSDIRVPTLIVTNVYAATQSNSATYKNIAAIGRTATVAIDDIYLNGTYYRQNAGNSGYGRFFCAGGTWLKNTRIDVRGNGSVSSDYGKGWLFVGEEMPAALDVTLGPGGFLLPNPSASCETLSGNATATSAKIGSLNYQGGKMQLDYDATTDAFDCLTITGAVTGVTSANPIVIRPSADLPAATATGRYPILKVATSALTLTSDLLDVSALKYDDTSKAIKLTIAQDGDYWVASVGPDTVANVYLVTGDAAAAATTAFNGNGSQWSDGLAPHPAPYVVALGENEGDGLWFPTASATFGGLSLAIGDLDEDTAGRADFNANGLTYTFDHLYLNKGQLRQHAPGNNRATTFNGEGQVNSTAADPFTICGENGQITIATSWLKGEEDAVLVVKGTGTVNAFGISAGSQWASGGYDSYKGRIILDAAFSENSLLQYAGTFKTNAITLRNGAALRTTAASPSWNSNAGITVEASGGRINTSYGGTLSLYNQIVGGPLTLACTINLYNRTSLSDFISSASVTVRSAATCDNAHYEVRGGTLTFYEGVTFTPRATTPEICVTNATLNAGAGMLAALRPIVCAGGVLAIANDGPLCQTATTTNAVLCGGATLKFDVDAENGTCDSLAVVGDAASVTATEASPLHIVVVPADDTYEPAPGQNFTFDLLTLPAGAGSLSKRAVDLSFASPSCLDGLRLYILQLNGRQVVRLTNRNPGTCVMLR